MTTLLTCFLLSLSEWYFSYLQIWGITNLIHPVTAKSVLIWIFLFCHVLHTEELSITGIYESILSGSLVSILSSSSVSLSDELHTLKDDEIDTGNISLVSRSYDDLIIYIFHSGILEYLVHSCFVTIWNTKNPNTRKIYFQ